MILFAPHEYYPRPVICRRTGKPKYDKKGAETAIKKRIAGRNAPAAPRAYECRHCHGWHLTSKEKREGRP